MISILTEKQLKERLKELISFCKETDDNRSLMYNHMLAIQRIRNEAKPTEPKHD